MTMYWHTLPDGSMHRKLVEDWTAQERELHARHEAFLKEADALGYVFRLDIDSLKWVGSFKKGWVGLTEEEIKHIEETTTCLKNESWLRNLTQNLEAKLKEKNT
jgi:hypothetical protein